MSQVIGNSSIMQEKLTIVTLGDTRECEEKKHQHI